ASQDGSGRTVSPRSAIFAAAAAALGCRPAACAATMQAPTSVAAREAADSIRVALAKIEAIINTSSELVNRKSRLGYLERELRRLLDQVHLVCRQFEETEESIRDEAMADPERLQIVDRLRPLVQALRTLEMATAGLCELGESVHFDVASLVDRLGNEAIRIRMVPLRQLFQKCPRMVRELGRKLGREVEFEYTGDDTEIDKVMLEQLEDPLVHMLRNAIDHGIEPPGDRLRAGKPPRGTIRLGASHRQGQVVIELSDDGAGMSAHDIGEKAAQVGLVTQERLREMSRDEVLGLIFAPGFSTRREVSEVSGRGVGMDVVRTNIGRLHGRVEIRTTVGQGSTFVLHLPLTLSIIHALVVVNGGATYCVPAGSILEALKVAPGVLEEIGGRTVMSHRGAVLPVATLAQVLGLPAGPLARDAVNLLVVAGARKRIGLLVDDIDCEVEIVIKPLGQLLRCVNNVSGATIRPRGDLAIVLDPDSLVTSANELWQAPTGAVVPRQAQPRIKTAHRSAVPTRAPILVVEDSVTSREMLVGILESAGFVPVIFVTNLDEGGRRDPRQVQEASCLVQKRDFEQETLIRKIRELLGE
ncbi:MAG: chemotaxis protein CheA, partial [Candidatus Riflebacteria bacterium]|nr:chemotaxis protein CheA [Candidatus Riflebacteria bacterium]